MTIYKTLENGVKIVEYEERFAAGLADMWNRSKLNWGGGSEIETEQGQLDYYRSGSYYNVYLAIHGEEVVGLCSLRRYYKDLDALYIHVLNVRPDYMSKKIGKALILLSLERTMELGYPRLEIHTWPGNTSAVPLYKKCGFMWEDNSETTHLTCFIPTIISQELLKPFFAEADWYADSIRKLDIKLELNLPVNDYVRFDKSSHIVEIGSPASEYPKTALASVHTGMTVLKPGHIKLKLPCIVTLSDGQRRDIDVSLDIINQSLTSCFSFMTEDSYGIANGTFRLETEKASNNTLIFPMLHKNLHPEEELLLFISSKLGKPYDDEFNLKMPIETKAYQSGTDMVMELSYRSEKQAGITMTMIYSLNASGVVTRRHSLHNAGTGKKSLYLSECIFTTISNMPTFRYDGRITRSHDAADDGVNSVDASLFEENWVFEDKPGLSVGVCWDRGLKPAFRFNDGIILEHELNIESGGIAETPPVIVCLGVFNNYTAFRDYALQITSDRIEPAEDLLEIAINGSNPFVYGDELTVGIRNNRSKSYVGKLEIFPCNSGLFEATTLELKTNANVSLRLDKSKIIGGWGRVQIRTNFPAYLSHRDRSVYFPSGSVDSSYDGDILAVSNGLLTFKSDPTHYPGLFSLAGQDGSQWLMSRHPKLEPYGWWSPFVGGMRVWMEKMDANNTLKENISASFAEMKDNFGNLWQGIRTKVEVSECREYRGLSYESYYLTLPGIPVMCYFTRFVNRTGGTLGTFADTGVFFKPGEQGFDREAEVTHYGKSSRFILCSEESEFETRKAEFVRITSPCGSKLHWLPNLADRRSSSQVVNDAYACGAYLDFHISLRNGSELKTCPMFVLLGDRDLELEELEALARLVFSE